MAVDSLLLHSTFADFDVVVAEHNVMELDPHKGSVEEVGPHKGAVVGVVGPHP